jgi:integral membrane protein (TIGR01906 family)
MKDSSIPQRILVWVVRLVVPVVLTLLAVRLVMNPWYVEFEYRTPNFPADEYGFTREERLKYSKVAIEYLVNDADISFLGDLQFPEGQQAPGFSCQFMDDCTKMYNERELGHMLDVKIVVQGALKVLYAGIVILVGLGIWAWFGKWWKGYLAGLQGGGWLTVALLGGIILFVLLAFGVIFVYFHEIFFASGTWTFYYSDTLIRMFPERFWRDTFLMVGGIAGVLGVALGWGLRKYRSV